MDLKIRKLLLLLAMRLWMNVSVHQNHELRRGDDVPSFLRLIFL